MDSYAYFNNLTSSKLKSRTEMATEPTVTNPHVEHLLAEIESSDGLLGPTLRYSNLSN